MLDFKSAPKTGRGPSNEHFWQVWLKSVQWFQRRRFKCEKLTDGRTTDAYPWQKLTWPMARWAKNSTCTNVYPTLPVGPTYYISYRVSYAHLHYMYKHSVKFERSVLKTVGDVSNSCTNHVP
jgi:hypothetical protein